MHPRHLWDLEAIRVECGRELTTFFSRRERTRLKLVKTGWKLARVDDDEDKGGL